MRQPIPSTRSAASITPHSAKPWSAITYANLISERTASLSGPRRQDTVAEDVP